MEIAGFLFVYANIFHDYGSYSCFFHLNLTVLLPCDSLWLCLRGVLDGRQVRWSFVGLLQTILGLLAWSCRTRPPSSRSNSIHYFCTIMCLKTRGHSDVCCVIWWFRAEHQAALLKKRVLQHRA